MVGLETGHLDARLRRTNRSVSFFLSVVGIKER
jgi:hypothetical protein